MSVRHGDRTLSCAVAGSAVTGGARWKPTTGRQGKRDRRRSVPKWLVELRNSETVNFGPDVGSPRTFNDFNEPTGVVRLPQLSEEP